MTLPMVPQLPNCRCKQQGLYQLGNLRTYVSCLVFFPPKSKHRCEKITGAEHQLTLTVKDDDPAVSTAGLGVVAEAYMVALRARRLAAVTLVHFVATETGVS